MNSEPVLNPGDGPKNPSSKLYIVWLSLFIVIGGAVFLSYKRTNTQMIKSEAPQAAVVVLSPVTQEKYESLGASNEASNTCQFNSDFLTRRECEEKFLFEKYSMVKRNNECLELTIGGNQVKKMCDTPDEFGRYYTFRGYFPGVGYWLTHNLYEGSRDYLVDERDGQEFQIFGEPIFSPSGNKFLSVSSDIEAQYNPNGFQIWEKRETGYHKTLEISQSEFGILDPVWENEDSFYFKRRRLDSTPPYAEIIDYFKYQFAY